MGDARQEEAGAALLQPPGVCFGLLWALFGYFLFVCLFSIITEVKLLAVIA